MVDHRLQIGGEGWSILAVRDQDALLAASDGFEHPPYGLLLWESAIALAECIARRGRSGFASQRILEIGCGVGLAGAVAASLGAEVTQTDHEPRALEIAAGNARRNGVGTITQFSADWRRWSVDARFDIILGADIAYETAMHPHLRTIFKRNLALGGRLLLADPGRQQMLELLCTLEAEDGWRIEVETVLVPDAAGRAGKPPVRVTLAEARRDG